MTTAKKSNAAFPGMHQLDSNIHLYKPDLQLWNKDESGPKLIILCTWMGAYEAYITKYVLAYQSLFPRSIILLIRSGALDFIHPGRKALERRLEPALSVIRTACSSPSSQSSSTSELLLHIFSNGGSLQASTLLRSYLLSTGNPLPLHATVIDSAPGRATFGGSYNVLLLPLRNRTPILRIPAALLLLFFLGVWWFLMFALRMNDPFETLWDGLLDYKPVQETKRVYIYSDVDDMVSYKDIEEHIREAKDKGFNVQVEKYHGSGHCAHVRVGGGERYWAIVTGLWKESVSDQNR